MPIRTRDDGARGPHGVCFSLRPIEDGVEITVDHVRQHDHESCAQSWCQTMFLTFAGMSAEEAEGEMSEERLRDLGRFVLSVLRLPPGAAGIPPAERGAVAPAVMNERLRCAEIARQRAELWRRTPLATSGLGAGREEARARANEATVIADLIETPPLSEVADEGDVN